MYAFSIFERIRIKRQKMEAQYAANRIEAALITSQRLDILIHRVTLLRHCRLYAKMLHVTALRRRHHHIAA